MTERNAIQRRLRRAKDSERRLGKWLLLHNGPDPRYQLGGGIVTTTGRVGHITGLRFDCLSMDYVGENKNEKVPATWWRYWTLVVAKGIEEGKHPIIRVEPTNDTDRLVLGRKVPNIHMISEDRHAELLGYERAFREGRTPDVPPAQVAEAPQLARLAAGPVRSYSKEAQLGRSPKKGRSK